MHFRELCPFGVNFKQSGMKLGNEASRVATIWLQRIFYKSILKLKKKNCQIHSFFIVKIKLVIDELFAILKHNFSRKIGLNDTNI